MDKVKRVHWENWLEGTTPRDIYTANNYITGTPTDYANARIPSLKRPNHRDPNAATTTNLEKAEELSTTFFPPPPISSSIPSTAYPKPLEAFGYFSCKDIRKTIRKLKPFKAPSLDGIQNIILQMCIDTIRACSDALIIRQSSKIPQFSDNGPRM